jgi:alkylhydroperoxidase family enzyme
VGSHAAALRRQGVSDDIVDAIGTGDLSKVSLTPKDAALLKFVKLLTLNSSHTRDTDVQEMRTAGWIDEQIWETAFEVGIFSFLNRMADVYGLDYPSTGWYPPRMREKIEQQNQAAVGK